LLVLGLDVKPEVANLFRNAGYETPGYEKSRVRNVWHPFRKR